MTKYRESTGFLVKISLGLAWLSSVYILVADIGHALWSAFPLPPPGMGPVGATCFLALVLSLNALRRARTTLSLLLLILVPTILACSALIFQQRAPNMVGLPWLDPPEFTGVLTISSLSLAILLTSMRRQACSRAAVMIACLVTGADLLALVGVHLPEMTDLITPSVALLGVLVGVAAIGANHQGGREGAINSTSVEAPALRTIFLLVLLGPVVLGVVGFHLTSYSALRADLIAIVVVCAHIALGVSLLFWVRGRIGRGVAARKALTRALDAAPVAITDADGYILYWSKGCETLYGLSAASADGRHKRSLLGAATGTEPSSFLREGMDMREVELTERRSDGTVLHVREQIRPLGADADGRHLFALVMTDITDKYAAQVRQAELREELIHVSRLSAIGEAAAGLAHELKQPLAATTNFLGVAELMLGSGAIDGEQLRSTLMLASEQALRAGQIAHRFEAFLTKRSADIRPEPVDETIQGAIDLAITGMKFEKMNIDYRHRTTHPFMLADRVQFQQVMLNLIRNAIEAQADDPREDRSIFLTTEDAGNDMIRISVQDRGPGIAEEVLRASYRPFTSTKSDGMGLGLSICRRIVEFHGGTIHAENLPEGGGALLWFTIPAAQPLSSAA